MPTHASAIKRDRQSIKRRTRNRTTRSAVRSAVKVVHTNITAGDFAAAKVSLSAAESAISRAAAKGIFHPKSAQRKISRLAGMIAKASVKKN